MSHAHTFSYRMVVCLLFSVVFCVCGYVCLPFSVFFFLFSGCFVEVVNFSSVTRVSWVVEPGVADTYLTIVKAVDAKVCFRALFILLYTCARGQIRYRSRILREATARGVCACGTPEEARLMTLWRRTKLL